MQRLTGPYARDFFLPLVHLSGAIFFVSRDVRIQKNVFIIAILGNPASRDQIEKILDIKRPTFFQVSLEGLQKHNDTIRGKTF